MASRLSPIRTTAAAFVLAILLGACASAPEVVQSGALQAGGYALAADAAAEPAEVKALLAQSLAAAGLSPTEPASADYIVQIGQAEAPVVVGAYASESEKDEAAWFARPRRGMPWTGSQRSRVRIVLLDARTGRVVFSGSANLRARGAGDAARLGRLIAASLTLPGASAAAGR